jgi:hypothetical protein
MEKRNELATIGTSKEGNFSALLDARNEANHEMKAIAAIESNRAMREVEASIMVAKSRPRDELDAYADIMRACSRPSFAEKAIYRYKRGEENVEGASIRLAECLARAYGNIDYGWRELERNSAKSLVEAFCWDLQTNTKRKMTFEVIHVRDTKKGQKILTTERDIYEHIANHAARRVRACVLSIIPADLIEDAMKKCKEIMVSGINQMNKNDVAKKIVAAFEEIGVSHEQLRKYLGVEKVIGANENQLVELRQIYVSIKEGQASVKEFFKGEIEPKIENGPKNDATHTDVLIGKLENMQQ